MLITVLPSDAGTRLDSFISQNSELSRSGAAKLIDDGMVTVNGKAEQKKYAVRAGDEIIVTLPELQPAKAKAEDIKLDIVYEDEHLLVINKPSGMVVHPAAGNYEGTLVNALLYYCPDELSGINGEQRPGIVHRIDKDTSGLLVVAKTDAAHKGLSAQLADHSISREYRALVHGGFSSDEGTVDLPIGRHPVDRKKMAVIRNSSVKSRDAITHYTVLERFGKISYLALKLETGRTHQIRVHLKALGHPIYGDTLYGYEDDDKYMKRQALHAYGLDFKSPRTKEELSLRANLPQDIEDLLKILR